VESKKRWTEHPNLFMVQCVKLKFRKLGVMSLKKQEQQVAFNFADS
jgi:hypothetical protein